MKTRKVKVSDLKDGVFVRTKINDDRVIALMLLIGQGVRLDRIRVTPDLVIIDGRHRRDAYIMEKGKDYEIEVEIVEVSDETKLIGMAYRANCGGALPPTKEDTEHTIQTLLGKNLTLGEIAKLMGLPVSIIRSLSREVKKRLHRNKLVAAQDAIVNGGLTLSAAAERYGLDRKELSGTIRRPQPENGIERYNGMLTTNFKSNGKKTAAILHNLFQKLEDGDVKPSQVRNTIEHVESLQKLAVKAVAGWRSRLENKIIDPVSRKEE